MKTPLAYPRPVVRAILGLGLVALGLAHGSAVLSAADTAATPPDRTQWFREARFGLFIHWGVYAVPAGQWQGQPVKGIGEWIMLRGRIPVQDYRAFAKDFTAANYDPKAWAALAREAGMKYVVITSKHHDGFALYDSAVTDWNAVKASGAGRDLLAPLAAAMRAEGLKFGLYYSQAQDWNHPGGARTMTRIGIRPRPATTTPTWPRSPCRRCRKSSAATSPTSCGGTPRAT